MDLNFKRKSDTESILKSFLPYNTSMARMREPAVNIKLKSYSIYFNTSFMQEMGKVTRVAFSITDSEVYAIFDPSERLDLETYPLRENKAKRATGTIIQNKYLFTELSKFVEKVTGKKEGVFIPKVDRELNTGDYLIKLALVND